MVSTEDTPYGACFLLGKPGKIGQRTVLASTANSKLTVQSEKSGCKHKQLLNIVKTEQGSLLNLPASEIGLSDILAL